MWAQRYVGIPFAPDGHSAKGCNCWGLVHLVLKEQAGIVVPTYGDLSADDMIAAARAFAGASVQPPWQRIEPPPQAFDVVLMSAMTEEARPRRISGHCGVCIDARAVLHVWKATAACLMPLDHPRIRHKILGFYRHA